jgi:rhamnosyltransferase
MVRDDFHRLADNQAIGLVIPTLNAGRLWIECLSQVSAQSLKPGRLLVIDSASTDDTCRLADSAGFEVVKIDRSQFNHGGTRQWAAEYLSGCDIVVFMTQDAVLADRDALKEMVRCFEDPSVAVVYGRQLPRRGATAIETHARLFNYGTRSVVKNSAAAASLGSKVFFCSNSFAAYRRSVLLQLGGFKHDLILGEDMEFAARAIKAGYASVYCAASSALHSHDYSLRQVLERYFDLGVFDAQNAWMRECFGSHRGEGIRFMRSELGYLFTHSPLQIPKALLHTGAKLAGYRLGRMEKRLPTALKKKLSMFPGYWREKGAGQEN